jgi:hypothetical protein
VAIVPGIIDAESVLVSLIRELLQSEFKDRGNPLGYLEEMILNAISKTDFFSLNGQS